MEHPNDETDLKVFNTAKVYAEKILFPLMFDFKKFKRQTNYGHEDQNSSLEMPEEIRDIQRVNGLKGMAETTHDLLTAISSTVRIKNNKKEIEEYDKLTELISKIESIFYNHKEIFFSSEYKNNNLVEVINRIKFDKVKEIIDACYINTEILMTKNKLLFADSKDEFKSDRELMDEIKREYIGE